MVKAAGAPPAEGAARLSEPPRVGEATARSTLCSQHNTPGSSSVAPASPAVQAANVPRVRVLSPVEATPFPVLVSTFATVLLDTRALSSRSVVSVAGSFDSAVDTERRRERGRMDCCSVRWPGVRHRVESDGKIQYRAGRG